MSATVRGPYNYIAGSGISVVVVLNASTGQFDVTVTNTSPGLSTPVSVPNGGTGDTSLTAHSVLVGAGTSPVVQVGPGSFGAPLRSTGASSDPAFGTLDLTNNFAVTGTATHAVLIGNVLGTISSLSPLGSSGQVLTSNGASADPSFQSLPTMASVVSGAGISVTGGPAYTVAVAAATAHAVMLTTGAPGFTSTAPGAAGGVLTSNGATSDPTFQTPAAAQTNSQFTSHIGGSSVSLPSGVTTLDSLTVTVASGQKVIVWGTLHIFNNAADGCNGDITVDSTSFSASAQSIASLNTAGAVSHPLIREFTGLSVGTHTIRLLANNGTHAGTSSVEWTMLAMVVSG